MALGNPVGTKFEPTFFLGAAPAAAYLKDVAKVELPIWVDSGKWRMTLRTGVKKARRVLNKAAAGAMICKRSTPRRWFPPRGAPTNGSWPATAKQGETRSAGDAEFGSARRSENVEMMRISRRRRHADPPIPARPLF